ncbi:MAG: glycosyltransferase family 4 protein [Bacteroidota bacterium]
MKLLFLLPDIQGIPTGGNIYNQEMMQRLKAYCTVEEAVWTPATSMPALLAPGYDWAFVDSLLVDHLDVDALRNLAGQQTRWGILVHYFPFFDPHHAASDVAIDGLLAYDLYVTTSAYSKACLADAGISEELIAVIYPGLDAAHRVARPARAMRGAVRLLTVSSLLAGKGLAEFIDVLSNLAEHPVLWHWQLVGSDTLDPEYAAALFGQMQASAAAARMTWRGPLAPAQMPACFREADLFVLPSRFETLGMAVREAMAAGVPVAAFDVGGIPESLSDGAGVMVAPFRYGQMGEVLARLLDNVEEREVLGQRGLARSRHFPSWETSADTLLALLN